MPVFFIATSRLSAHDAPEEMEMIIVEGKAESLILEAPSASKGQSSSAELLQRPFLRRGELLEVVPGVIITQHSGDGKANQYFLRGINLDHGTDFGMSLEGMPINMRSHAHGQGYADLNIIVPELIESVDYRKGPSFADLGDLSAAGAARFKLWDALPQGIASVTWGQNNYWRSLLADTISWSDAPSGTTTATEKSASPHQHLTYALEQSSYDGPWTLPQDSNRWNGLVRYVWEDPSGERLSLTGAHYQARWDSTDQIPLRAVRSGDLGRYDAIDPTNGGDSQRSSILISWDQPSANKAWHVDAYVSRYSLDLFSNFTYFLDDPELGDQFEQTESRWMAGGTIRRDWLFDLSEASASGTVQQSRISLGLETRHDWIDDIGLYKTQARDRHTTVRQDDVVQGSYGLFLDTELRLTPWLRLQPGLRADVFNFSVDNQNGLETDDHVETLLSPKLNVILGPWSDTELYLNAGYGFHSNDARGVTSITAPADPLVRLGGLELGVRTEAMDTWVHTVSLWYLHSQSELVYVGDAGSNEAGLGSHRYGIEVANYWRPQPWVTLDSEFTLTHSEFDSADGGQAIPGSVPLTWSGGVTVGKDAGFFGALRGRFFAPRPLTEDGSIESADSLQINARVGYRQKHWEVAVECLNLFDRQDNDIEYAYESRLQGEATPTEDIHLHPVEPRTFRVMVTYRF